MKVYIASSWKNQHAVEMLTEKLRALGITVLSFIENNFDENPDKANPVGVKRIPFDEWVWSESGRKSFEYDTNAAIKSDLVIYISPSGTDAWCEVGAAWAAGVSIIGLWSKGEQCGLMRRTVQWYDNHRELMAEVIVRLRKFNERNPDGHCL